MDLAFVFLTLGGLLFAGLVADEIGRRTALPRATVLLLCGVLAGRSGLDLIPAEAVVWFEFLSVAALTMVAFLLGGALTVQNFRAHGRTILSISVSIVTVTIVVVGAGLWAVGVDPATALVLGAIASATAPATTQDAIRQTGVENGFTETLKGIVAIDDAWGLIAFSLVVVLAQTLNGSGSAGHLGQAAWEIGGALGLACVIGFPAAVLTGRLSGGEPLQIEALGLVFVTAGAALLLEVSYLIAGMTVGAIIVNRARHHTRAFHEIEHIQWPFMILFFILAGAALEIDRLQELGLIGATYIVLRTLARLLGGWIGARIGRAPVPDRPWYGVALLPQAGVAIGMALVASEQFPDRAGLILSLTIGSTILFEIIGPVATMFAVRKRADRPLSEGSGAGDG